MVEKNLVVDQKILEYRGLFEFDEMIRTLDSLVKSKGYELQEKKAEETPATAVSKKNDK